jgi:1-acyl-sn-glycerol-3-phosphate acyltransferase
MILSSRSSDTPEAVAAAALEMPWIYRATRAAFWFLFKALFRVEITGADYLRQPGGPLLVATNHLHWLDAPLALAIMPFRGTAFAADKWATHPFIGPLFRIVGNAIFVQRGEIDRRALTSALAVLKAGGVLGVAPEGTRSKTGQLQSGRGGAAYLAARTGATILPMVMCGQEKAFQTRFCSLRRPLIQVIVGEPFTLPGAPNHARGDQLDAYTELIMQRMAELLPPEYRGVYA